MRDYVNHALTETKRGARQRREAEDRRAARAHRHQPRQRRADPDVRRRLRADGVRHRRDHGRAGPRRARLRVRARVRPADPARDRGHAPERGRATSDGLPYTGDGPLVNSDADFDGMAQPRGARARSSRGSTARARATRRSTTACATGWSRASATGAARSRSSTARAAAWCRCPTEQLPVVLPDIEDYTPKGRSPLAAAEDWVQHELPLLRRRGAPRDRHDGHVRRLLLVLPALLRRRATTRPPGTRRRCASGCPSTSTSAASSTRSCT